VANLFFPLSATALIKADLDFDTMDCRVVPYDTATYTYSATHDFLNDHSGAVATAVALASETVGVVGNGVFDAADISITGVTGPANALLLYNHTGTSSTSHLLAKWDASITGLPATLTAGTLAVTWHATGIIIVA
jgi:hypothetical protein